MSDVIETRAERIKRQKRESYHRRKNDGWVRALIECAHCAREFLPKTSKSRYCSKNCGQNAQYAARPDLHRDSTLRRKYGVSLEEWAAQVALQEGRCATCGRVPEDWLVLDHDHETKKPRGALCASCNVSLSEDITAETLRAMADYLEKGGVWQ